MNQLNIIQASSRYNIEKSCVHMRDFLTEKGLTVNLEAKEIGALTELPVPNGKQTVLRCDPDQGAELIKQCSTISVAIQQTGAADYFVHQYGAWQPALLLKEALHGSLIRYGKQMDLRGIAFLIGQKASLRVTASVCLEMGFGTLYFVGDDVEDLHRQKDLVSKSYLGAQIVCLPAHEMTLQKTCASLLINCEDLTTRAELSADLAYFNFMLQHGVILDLSDSEPSRNILEEAHRANLRVIPSSEVWLEQEIVVAERLKAICPVSEEEYARSWRSRAATLQNQSSV